MKKVFFIGFTDLSSESQVRLSRRFLHMLCAKYEFEAVFPSNIWDIQYQIGEPLNDPTEVAGAIFRNTLVKLLSADAVVASFDIFNGICSNDDAFLIGFAHAKSKRVVGFIDAERTYEPRQTPKAETPNPTLRDQKESITRPVSRMTACATSINIQGDIEECFQYLFDKFSSDADLDDAFYIAEFVNSVNDL